jgi:hypothetical protein
MTATDKTVQGARGRTSTPFARSRKILKVDQVFGIIGKEDQTTSLIVDDDLVEPAAVKPNLINLLAAVSSPFMRFLNSQFSSHTRT